MVDHEGTVHTRMPAVDKSLASQWFVEWRWPLIGACALLALYVWQFGIFLRSQGIHATYDTADWGHTLVVPFIAGYFVYLNRQKLIEKPFKTTWFALVPIIMGVGVYALATVGPKPLRHFNIEGFGAWLTLFGLVFLFCGWRAMLYLWFPLVYILIFGQKISDNLLTRVTFQMQDITARGAHFVLNLFVDVDRTGNTLFIFYDGERKPLNIAEACSGMRMLMAFLALGVAMAYTGFKRFWQRAALVIMAVPTAIFVNVLRVVTLGMLSIADADFAAGDFHSFIGLVWLVPAFLIFLGFMSIISHLVIENTGAEKGAG
jgi:exosortase